MWLIAHINRICLKCFPIEGSIRNTFQAYFFVTIIFLKKAPLHKQEYCCHNCDHSANYTYHAINLS